MKAVNLIPRDTRTRRERVSISPQMMAAIGGLGLVLVAAVLYVSAANTVSTRKHELARVTAGAVSWTAAATAYASFVQAAQRHGQQLSDVRALATSRFPWSQLLDQIGELMPGSAALSGLDASTTSATGASGVALPAVQLSGCATSQSTVADTMVQLKRIDGVSAVTLASSTATGAGASTSGGSTSSTASQAGGACPFPVQFQVSLTFGASFTADAAATGASTTAPPASSATGAPTTGAAQ